MMMMLHEFTRRVFKEDEDGTMKTILVVVVCLS